MQRGLAIDREQGNLASVAVKLHNLSLIALDDADYDTARRLLEESLEVKRTIGSTIGIASSLGALGEVVRRQGDSEAATAYLEESLVLRRQIGDDFGAAIALNSLAEVAQHEGDLEAARTHMCESLRLFREQDAKNQMLLCVAGLARLEAQARRGGRAAALLGAVNALRAQHSLPAKPYETDLDREASAAARRELGDAGYERRFSEGGRLSLSETIAYALGGPSPIG
jgi:tetratricopeptide (TPR) repeat protein